MHKKCPKCKSDNTKLIDYLGTKTLKCGDCGFDESKELDVFPEQRETQREKGRYTPYKSGGKARTRK
jgi:Zn ribbon nucleic-acid-binding protein